MTEKRKKPVKLEWQGGIASVAESESAPVRIRSAQFQDAVATAPSSIAANGAAFCGTLKIRRETKHRAGHAVLVLFDFTQGNPTPESLRLLCGALRQSLACGGTVDNNEIVLQTSDAERVIKVLGAKGVTAKKAGGF